MSYEVYRNGFIVVGIILGIVAYLVYDWESEIVGMICAGIAALFYLSCDYSTYKIRL